MGDQYVLNVCYSQIVAKVGIEPEAFTRKTIVVNRLSYSSYKVMSINFYAIYFVFLFLQEMKVRLKYTRFDVTRESRIHPNSSFTGSNFEPADFSENQFEPILAGSKCISEPATLVMQKTI